jgi:hypothetical protein
VGTPLKTAFLRGDIKIVLLQLNNKTAAELIYIVKILSGARKEHHLDLGKVKELGGHLKTAFLHGDIKIIFLQLNSKRAAELIHIVKILSGARKERHLNLGIGEKVERPFGHPLHLGETHQILSQVKAYLNEVRAANPIHIDENLNDHVQRDQKQGTNSIMFPHCQASFQPRIST